MKKEYTKDDLTVVWQPELCLHSANCVRQLSAVFKPKDKPWIQLENGEKVAIIDAVQSCPSGALSYYLKTKEKTTSMEELPLPAFTKVIVNNNGPLIAEGAFLVQLADGSTVERTGKSAFCRCGKSKNAPFCDGTHRGQPFE